MWAPHSYFNFLLASTNQHGIHSPFVFDLVTQGLYPKIDAKSSIIPLKKFAKSNRTTYKSLELLLKTIRYFKCKKIDCSNFPNSNKFVKILNQNFQQNLRCCTTENEIVYFDFTDDTSFSKKFATSRSNILCGNTIIFVNNIHQNKNTFSAWQKLIEIPEITVSIDFYYAGLLFERPQQAKEHFIVRY